MGASELMPVVVGLGASAGGLDALKKFFSAMPVASGAAFVVVQHLDPDHESLMAELLARCTDMPVVQVEDEMLVEDNRVYIIPPNKYLTMSNGRLCLSEPTERRGMRMAIDTFFRSLARECKERAIAVVLSGTGTDGTLGVKEIKEQGGLVLVQDPNEAAHDGMPRSATATDIPDRVLPVETMPEVITGFINHPYLTRTNSQPPAARAPDQMETILAVLRSHARLDFRCYKRQTLARRIDRRMGLGHIERVPDYIELLRTSPREVELLTKDFLIGVTGFFRDPAAFQALAEEVLPNIVRGKSQDDSVRVWVPGCSSGEEAYSIAMLLLEEMARQNSECRLQVFATDIDVHALEVARGGVYPEASVAEIPPERIRRFFRKQGESYKVNKALRDAVVFAQQNLISDPPFSRQDMISCRNLLIYLKSEIQTRVMERFHFAMVHDGYLMLGTSEGVSGASGMFSPISNKWRIFRRIGGAHRPVGPFPLMTPDSRPGTLDTSPDKRGRPFTLRDHAQEQLLGAYAPPSVVVTPRGDIHYYFGDTKRFLTQPTGEPTTDIMSLVRHRLRGRLRAALVKATRAGEEARSSSVDGTLVVVRPLSVPDREDLYLLSFLEQAEPRTAVDPSHDEEIERDLIRQLEIELETTREDLQSTIEELETANEELKASNEEAMSMNEELQSTNEEIETSKEELQSLNEELTTVNSQLQDKVHELEAANNDIVNLLGSTDIATLFLDRELRIKRYTPSTCKLMNVIPTDIGRPFTDIAMKFSNAGFADDARLVLSDLEPREVEIEDDEGHWYRRRLLPYRTEDGRIDGVVATFVDIHENKLAEQELRRMRDGLEERTRELEEAVQREQNEVARRARVEETLRTERDRIQTILDTVVDGIISTDEDGTIVTVNKAAEAIFGYTAAEMIGHKVAMLMSEPDRSAHHQYLERYHQTGEKRIIGIGRVVEGRRADGTAFPMELAIGESNSGGEKQFTGVFRDITGRELAQQNRRALLDASFDEVLLMSHDGTILEANHRAAEHLGKPRGELIGMNTFESIPTDDTRLHRDWAEEVIRTREPLTREYRSGERMYETTVQPLFDLDGVVDRLAMHTRDITDIQRHADELRELADIAEAANQAKSRFLANMSHEIRTPMNAVIGMTGLLLGQKLDAQAADMIETIQRAGFSLLSLINDILDFSKIEAGKLEIESIPFNPRSMVADVADELVTRAHEQGIEFIMDCEPAVPWQLIGDPVRLHQVVINLVGNAIKFTKRGHVLIRLGVQGGDARNVALRIAVEDTGIGISKARQKELFQPFVQADSSTTREFGGTGLGLSIVKKLIDLMGGEVGIRSKLGQGSTFWFVVTLPILADRPPASKQASELADVRILLVDDYRPILRMMGERLKEQGIRNAMVSSSAAALDTLRTATAADDAFHLVVVDQHMPDMDGVALARAVEADPDIRDTKVLVMTSARQRMTGEMAEDNQIQWVTKPAHGEALLRVLTRAWVSARAVDTHAEQTTSTSETSDSTEERPPRARVLVVEDNNVNQRVALRLLEQLDCEVELAANGLEALMLTIGRRYDMIFMDCQMPEMDGYDATRAIRARERESDRHTPIIAMTAHALQGDRDRCLAVGMDDYIAKPVSQNHLERIVTRWLSNDPHSHDTGAPPATVDIETVLVVDDSRTQRTAVAKFLRDEGYLVAEAEDGGDGLARVEEEHFDALIVDQQMPVMSGLEMVSKVRELDDYRDTLIVLLTMEAPRQAWWELGIDFWIRKTGDYQILANILSHLSRSGDG